MKWLSNIVTVMVLVLGALATSAAWAGRLPSVFNPMTGPITIDGDVGDWAGVRPLAYISPQDNRGPLVASRFDRPGTNALWFMILPEPLPRPVMTTMFASLARTQPFGFSEFVADVTIPLDPRAVLPGPMPRPESIVLQVHMASIFETGAESAAAMDALLADGELPPLPPVLYDVDIDGDRVADVDAAALGISAALKFGTVAVLPIPTPRPADDVVLLLEVSVPLHVDLDLHPEFATLFAGGAIGLVGPNPRVWSANFANDAIDPPFAIGTVGFNPAGQTTVVSGVPFPEPTSFSLAVLSVIFLSVLRLSPSNNGVGAGSRRSCFHGGV